MVKISKQTVVEEIRGASRKYLGSWACSKERDIKVRTALAWQSLNKVNNIWKSDFAEK